MRWFPSSFTTVNLTIPNEVAANNFLEVNNFDQELPSDIEKALILAVKEKGDLTAFHTLFLAHAPRIYSYLAFQLASQYEAEFLTGRVFIKAWREINDFDMHRASFLNWLYTLSGQSLIEYRRNKDRSASSRAPALVSQPETENAPTSQDLADYLPESLTNYDSSLHHSLLALPQDQQHVIYLRYIEEMTLAEISRHLGLEESLVHSILRGALHYLNRV